MTTVLFCLVCCVSFWILDGGLFFICCGRVVLWDFGFWRLFHSSAAALLGWSFIFFQHVEGSVICQHQHHLFSDVSSRHFWESNFSRRGEQEASIFQRRQGCETNPPKSTRNTTHKTIVHHTSQVLCYLIRKWTPPLCLRCLAKTWPNLLAKVQLMWKRMKSFFLLCCYCSCLSLMCPR